MSEEKFNLNRYFDEEPDDLFDLWYRRQMSDEEEYIPLHLQPETPEDDDPDTWDPWWRTGPWMTWW